MTTAVIFINTIVQPIVLVSQMTNSKVFLKILLIANVYFFGIGRLERFVVPGKLDIISILEKMGEAFCFTAKNKAWLFNHLYLKFITDPGIEFYGLGYRRM